MSEYDDLLRESYEGEVFGEAFFGALGDAVDDDSKRERLRTLQAVEADTASTLRPLVHAAGIEVDAAKTRDDGVALAASVTGQAWDTFLQGLRSALPAFLAKYERLQELAADRDGRVLANLVAHERAVDRFAELELDGKHDKSVAVLRAHLDTSRHVARA